MSISDSTLPRDKTDLMKRIQREWLALMRAIGGLAPGPMSAPMSGGWSIKDNLAHLAAWEQFLVHHHIHGQPPHQVMQIDAETFKRLDEAGINAMIRKDNRYRPAADVLANLRRSHAEVLRTLEAMSFSDLMKPRYSDDPEKRPLIGWVIGNTYEHYAEHRQNIERMLREAAPTIDQNR
jgi:hypothetical protein